MAAIAAIGSKFPPVLSTAFGGVHEGFKTGGNLLLMAAIAAI